MVVREVEQDVLALEPRPLRDAPADLLRQIGRQTGEVVEIALEEDVTEVPPPAEVPEPPELLAAVDQDPTVRAAYQALPPSHQREYARWIGEAKQAETRAERVTKMVRRLTGS